MARFNVYNCTSTFNLGRINKTVSRLADPNSFDYYPSPLLDSPANLQKGALHSRYSEANNRVYQYHYGFNERTGLRSGFMSVVAQDYYDTHTSETSQRSYPVINEISSLYNVKPLDLNSIIDNTVKNNRRIRRTLRRALSDSSLYHYFIPETNNLNIYSAFREVSQLEQGDHHV